MSAGDCNGSQTSSDPNAVLTFPIYCLDGQQQIDLLAIAIDSQGNALRYTTVRGAMDNQSVALPSWNQWITPTSFLVTVSNLPPDSSTSTLNAHYLATFNLSVGHNGIDFDEKPAPLDSRSSPVPFFSPGGFAETMLRQMDLTSYVSDATGSYVTHSSLRARTSPAVQDTNLDLSTLIPSFRNAQFVSSGQPSLTWDTPLTVGGALLTMNWTDTSTGVSHSWNVIFPGGSGIVTPRLPPELNAWTQVPNRCWFFVMAVDSSEIGSYDDFRNYFFPDAFVGVGPTSASIGSTTKLMTTQFVLR